VQQAVAAQQHNEREGVHCTSRTLTDSSCVPSASICKTYELTASSWAPSAVAVAEPLAGAQLEQAAQQALALLLSTGDASPHAPLGSDTGRISGGPDQSIVLPKLIWNFLNATSHTHHTTPAAKTKAQVHW
jgi:hypothetical protein